MALAITKFVDSDWVEVGTGLAHAILGAKGREIEFYVDGSAPSASDDGFPMVSGETIMVPGLSELGGGLWVRNATGLGSVIHATA